ncbi:GNAT family N-acetyltransferase [Cytobacillus praedii]|uniref:GNAT family N-acetyltransferase n=1 Tax=Cytobacillus praedii TaxID=1742358 RepID=UPI00070B1EAB|nr:GNAT family N-acetyltransferase [Cytobacillus praedii]
MPNNLLSMLRDYEVSVATSKEADHILGLLKEVAKWLKEKGIDQWGFLAGGGEDDEVRQAINNKETFIVKRDGEIVATFTLYQSQSSWDKYIWGNLNNEAVYLHRLAITRSKIGSGLGKEVLLWLETYLKKEGKNTIRLDCVGSNSKLNEFYRSNGFENVGTVDGHSMFQKNF